MAVAEAGHVWKRKHDPLCCAVVVTIRCSLCFPALARSKCYKAVSSQESGGQDPVTIPASHSQKHMSGRLPLPKSESGKVMAAGPDGGARPALHENLVEWASG